MTLKSARKFITKGDGRTGARRVFTACFICVWFFFFAGVKRRVHRDTGRKTRRTRRKPPALRWCGAATKTTTRKKPVPKFVHTRNASTSCSWCVSCCRCSTRSAARLRRMCTCRTSQRWTTPACGMNATRVNHPHSDYRQPPPGLAVTASPSCWRWVSAADWIVFINTNRTRCRWTSSDCHSAAYRFIN